MDGAWMYLGLISFPINWVHAWWMVLENTTFTLYLHFPHRIQHHRNNNPSSNVDWFIRRLNLLFRFFPKWSAAFKRRINRAGFFAICFEERNNRSQTRANKNGSRTRQNNGTPAHNNILYFKWFRTRSQIQNMCTISVYKLLQINGIDPTY